MSIGSRIREVREAKGLSQEKLAQKCGWENGQTRLSNYEKGKREPTIADFETIAYHTGSDPAYLAFGVRQENPEIARILQAYNTATPEEKAFILRACGVQVSEQKKRRGRD